MRILLKGNNYSKMKVMVRKFSPYLVQTRDRNFARGGGYTLKLTKFKDILGEDRKRYFF